MIVDEEVVESSPASSTGRARSGRRRAVAIGAATLAVTAGTVFAITVDSGASDSLDAPIVAVDRNAQDAGNDSAVAEPTQLRAPRSTDDAVRELVERGLVPAATLDDGTQIAGPGLRVVLSRDDAVRDLVERGLVPAATLDDGSHITGPGVRP